MKHNFKFVDGEVLIFQEGDEHPILRQPHWPDGTAWESNEQAETWGQNYINQIEDETAPLVGVTPSQPTRKRPTPQEVEEMRKDMPIPNITPRMIEELIAQKVAEALGE